MRARWNLHKHTRAHKHAHTPVYAVQHGDHFHRRAFRADYSKPDYVAEVYRHMIEELRQDLFLRPELVGHRFGQHLVQQQIRPLLLPAQFHRLQRHLKGQRTVDYWNSWRIQSYRYRPLPLYYGHPSIPGT